jgi:hypothetical protein
MNTDRHGSGRAARWIGMIALFVVLISAWSVVWVVGVLLDPGRRPNAQTCAI